MNRTKWFGLACALAIVFLGVITWRWTLSPSAASIDDVEPADAVVLFAGGRGERLETALALVQAGKADNLVIPDELDFDWPEAEALCGSNGPVEVYCPVPDPINTRGEARAFGDLAASQGWDSIIIVTSTYHVTRAELMLERCFAGEISAVAAAPGLNAFEWVPRTIHELLGHGEARILRRDC